VDASTKKKPAGKASFNLEKQIAICITIGFSATGNITGHIAHDIYWPYSFTN
jgi:hypothetical protein